MTVPIAHPGTQRSRGYLLVGYLTFCAMHGAMQATGACWLAAHGGSGLRAPSNPRLLVFTLAAAGVTTMLGAVSLWRWSGVGVVLLAMGAAAGIASGIQWGSTASQSLGLVMLAAAGLLAITSPWSLTCLRCRHAVGLEDNACPSCGQPFAR